MGRSMIQIDTIRRRILVPFDTEIKAEDAESGKISGYGAAFNNKDGGGDVIVPGAFKKSIDFYQESKAMPAMCWNHDQACPVGDWTTMQETGKGLFMQGQIWHGKGMPNAEMAYNVAKGTGMKGMSIGYKTLQADRDSKTDTRHIHSLALKEVSVLLWPMNDKAEILSVKGLMLNEKGEFKSIRDLEEILYETCKGLSHREVKALLADGYKGLANLREEDPADTQIKSFSKELRKLAESMTAT